MDFDGLSSSPPPATYSELPPSNVPEPAPQTNSTTARRPLTDALTMTVDTAEEGNEPGGTNRRKRPRQMNGDVPMVKDAVGESVVESFETFLKTFAVQFYF